MILDMNKRSIIITAILSTTTTTSSNVDTATIEPKRKLLNDAAFFIKPENTAATPTPKLSTIAVAISE